MSLLISSNYQPPFYEQANSNLKVISPFVTIPHFFNGPSSPTPKMEWLSLNFKWSQLNPINWIRNFLEKRALSQIKSKFTKDTDLAVPQLTVDEVIKTLQVVKIWVNFKNGYMTSEFKAHHKEFINHLEQLNCFPLIDELTVINEIDLYLQILTDYQKNPSSNFLLEYFERVEEEKGNIVGALLLPTFQKELATTLEKMEEILKIQAEDSKQIYHLDKTIRLNQQEYKIFKIHWKLIQAFQDYFTPTLFELFEKFSQLVLTLAPDPAIYINFSGNRHLDCMAGTHTSYLVVYDKQGQDHDVVYVGVAIDRVYKKYTANFVHPHHRKYKINVSKLMVFPPDLNDQQQVNFKKEFENNFNSCLGCILSMDYSIYSCDNDRGSLIKRFIFPFRWQKTSLASASVFEEAKATNDGIEKQTRKLICSQFVCEALIEAQRMTCKRLKLTPPDSLSAFGLYDYQTLESVTPTRLEAALIYKGIIERVNECILFK